ncbi:ribonuclease E activity regulator RraA [Fictibacillus gelatini]|uniref:ribonuclease E activity regulator RraA n=1 Tax=Fictibacillus gelatini TaxID=225985 RepID=UPI000422A6D5|nr:ribonuclease E activity regulator RraA [Fictibacillus gelatini]
MKTTDLCDEFYPDVSIAAPLFKSFGKKKSFSSQIATVQVDDDNVLIRKLLETLPPKTVLVVDGKASANCALLGDNLAGIAARRGLAGMIVNGYVRDTADLATIDIGILALGSFPLKSKKEGKGTENILLEFANVKWHPGHYVYVDEDGIVLSPTALEI